MWEAVGICQNITQNDVGTCERDPDSAGVSVASLRASNARKKALCTKIVLTEVLRIPYVGFSDKSWALLSQQRAQVRMHQT